MDARRHPAYAPPPAVVVVIGLLLGFVCIGLAVGIVVTDWLHRGGGWPRDFWQQRVDGTGLRYANLPVGGVALFIVTLPSILHWTPTSAACLGAAIGMSVAAVGWGLIYPLPPD